MMKKRRLSVFIFGIFVLINSFNAYGSSGFRYEDKPRIYETNEQLLPDSVSSGLVLLPFNIEDKDELAPTIRDKYLYYIERDGKRLGYSLFRITIDSTINQLEGEQEQSRWKEKKERIDIPANVYMNYSIDGKKLLLNTVNRFNTKKKLFIGDATDKQKDLVEFPYNGRRYSIGRATLSPNGEKLVFSSDMPGSVGGIDLWLSIYKNGSWSAPVNLGKEVNSAKDEAMPYWVSETKLCFASSGHDSFGGYDLFYTEFKNDIFSTPVNMGERFNTSSDEIGICYSSEFNMYYFASNRRGNYDIYSIDPHDELPEAIGEDVIAEENTESLQPGADTLFYSNELATQENLLSEEQSNQHEMNDEEEADKTEMSLNSFYAVQVMALRASTYSKTRVLQMFGMENQYYVVREDGWTKFRTGEYSSYWRAKKFAEESGIKKFYIVRMDDSQIEEYL